MTIGGGLILWFGVGAVYPETLLRERWHFRARHFSALHLRRI